MLPATTTGRELLALDAALEELARIEPRQAMMIESRFFGGLDIAETAALLGVSEATILRDWRAAKAWLTQALKKEVRRQFQWERIFLRRVSKLHFAIR
jgi:DNA-directed RNA polymerase specialized sigma24 family protein